MNRPLFRVRRQAALKHRGSGNGEAGAALLHVVLLLTIVTTAAAAAAMLARTGMLVSQYHREEREATLAAQAMLAAAIQDLDRMPQWDQVLGGSQVASFAIGPADARRQIPGGGSILICCGAGTMTARLEAESGVAWRPFGWESLNGLLSLSLAGQYYLVAWVADDPGDRDGQPSVDSNDRIVVRSEAVTSAGVRKAVETTVQRLPVDAVSEVYSAGLQMLTWREQR